MSMLLIGLLDKQCPPSHSFVDGMLAKAVAAETGTTVRLVVSGNGSQPPFRYFHASCVPSLAPRRGLGRFLNLFHGALAIKRGVRDARRRHKRAIVFVRNDPVLLLVAALMRGRYHRLIFQSSFPHEVGGRWSAKHGLARLLFRLAASRVDAITGVSPLGVERLRRLFPKVSNFEVIPLLADLPAVVARDMRSPGDPIRFIYIGSHAASRQMDLVIRAAAAACVEREDIEFLFVGGKEAEIAHIKQLVGEAAQHPRIRLMGAVPRTSIPQLLAKADVGLCLIPPLPQYIEASPTKLTEYMAAGLAVIASRGIPLQEQYVEESGGGLLVEWDESALTFALSEVQWPDLEVRALQGAQYALAALNYRRYLDAFNQLANARQ